METKINVKDLKVDINDVVVRMDSDKLDLAMQQVQSYLNELIDLGSAFRNEAASDVP